VANPLGFGFSKSAAGGIRYLAQHFSKLGQTFRDATARGVNEDTLTIPRVVFAANNLLPRWEPGRVASPLGFGFSKAGCPTFGFGGWGVYVQLY
jgi:hypothetical protein